MPALLSLARERTLPVAAALAPLLPPAALQRGQAIGCRGPAAPSLALALATEAVAAGAWAAAIDLPTIGLEAAAELGMPLERFVRVDGGDRGEGGRDQRSASGWADVVAAVLDGFEIVLLEPPAHVGAAVLRRIQERMQHRGAVLIIVGATTMPVDLTIDATTTEWEGAGQGDGHLRARRLRAEATGRRVPRPRRVELWLPGPAGGVGTAANPALPADDHRLRSVS